MSLISKGEARKRVRSKLAEYTKEAWRQKSLGVSQNLLKFLKASQENYSSGIIGGFAPLGDEVDWLIELDEFADQLAFPGTDDSGEMVFLQCRFDKMEVSKEFGVPIKSPPLDSPQSNPILLLVPGVAFSLKGDRLGRGKGYYDKYLSNFKGLKIGICTDEQLLEMLPTESHDIKMDGIITDTQILLLDS